MGGRGHRFWRQVGVGARPSLGHAGGVALVRPCHISEMEFSHLWDTVHHRTYVLGLVFMYKGLSTGPGRSACFLAMAFIYIIIIIYHPQVTDEDMEAQELLRPQRRRWLNRETSVACGVQQREICALALPLTSRVTRAAKV